MKQLLFDFPLKDHTFSRDDFGGKACSLNFLLRNEIRVPRTSVLSTEAHKIFLEHNGLQPFHVIAQEFFENGSDPEQLREAFKAESRKYKDCSIPETINGELNRYISKSRNDLFAIRSSANCEDGIDRAWAGQFNSYLNTQKTEVKKRVKACLASVFSPGVFYYALRHSRIDQPIDMAVIIQEMIPAELSGVCFTTNPISNDVGEVMIEFCEGLGEPLVSSQIIPHMYVIRKSDFAVSEYRCGNQKRIMRYGDRSKKVVADNLSEMQCTELTGGQIQQITEMAKTLEDIFGCAQDFEWTLAGGELIVVQSRNITT